jgi:hypothetical protein
MMDLAERTSSVRSLVIGACVVGGTATWATRFAVGYLLVPPACQMGTGILHIVHTVAVLISAGFVLLPILVLRRTDATPPVRFLLLLGVALNVFFLATILLESSAALVVDPCAKGSIP